MSCTVTTIHTNHENQANHENHRTVSILPHRLALHDLVFKQNPRLWRPSSLRSPRVPGARARKSAPGEENKIPSLKNRVRQGWRTDPLPFKGTSFFGRVKWGQVDFEKKTVNPGMAENYTFLSRQTPLEDYTCALPCLLERGLDHFCVQANSCFVCFWRVPVSGLV